MEMTGLPGYRSQDAWDHPLTLEMLYYALLRYNDKVLEDKPNNDG
jgi:hypothetical protein